MIFKDIWLDIKAVQERDPAARSALEVLLLYQGIHALIWHRFAHWFYNHKMLFIARLISQIARFFTLIEIHPGAQLGRGILIDHGAGVVIGETAVVGDNCTIYQGVTLGGVGTQDVYKRQLQKELKITVMFVTHDIREAVRLGTRVLVMENGRIAQLDTPEKIIRQPADDFVKQLFSDGDGF